MIITNCPFLPFSTSPPRWLSYIRFSFITLCVWGGCMFRCVFRYVYMCVYVFYMYSSPSVCMRMRPCACDRLVISTAPSLAPSPPPLPAGDLRAWRRQAKSRAFAAVIELACLRAAREGARVSGIAARCAADIGTKAGKHQGWRTVFVRY